MRALRKFCMSIVLIALATALVPSIALADSPYRGYIYDNLDDTPISINGYLYLDSINGFENSSGGLNGPEDIFAAADDTLYIAESGNNRILHMDQDNKMIAVYGNQEGKGKLNGPKGVFVNPAGDVFVADTLNRRIVVFDKSGDFIKEYAAPSSPLLGKNFVYSPSKLIVDKRGYLFVVSDGASQGLMQIKPDGTFAGFFGANHVGYDWTRVIVKLIATDEQKGQLASVRPPEFSNLYQDSEGFIFTTTLGIPVNQVKRLSAVGVDTLNGSGEFRYGDLYMPIQNGSDLIEAIVDVSVSKSGLITALDQTTGKLFQYDKLGNLLFIFGGIGDQDGLFKTPTSVTQTSDGTIYVADRTRNRIDRFYSTPFADVVHEASVLYVDGRYKESFEPWNKVLQMNSNYDLAYYAIGKALFRQQNYKEAMSYFKTARAQSAYSDALFEYRRVFVKENFGTLMTLVIGLFIVIRILIYGYRKRWFSKLLPSRKQLGEGKGLNEHL